MVKSFYPALSLTELFSNLGGVLGLWLGVGMMQVIDKGWNIAAVSSSLLMSLGYFSEKNQA